MADKKKKSSFWDNLSWDKLSATIEAAFSDDSKPKRSAHEDGPPWIKYVAMLTGHWRRWLDFWPCARRH